MTDVIKTVEDVREASTKALVAFYNAHNVDKPVKKFSDRKTAEARCIAIIHRLEIAAGGDSGGDDGMSELLAEAAQADDAAVRYKARKTQKNRSDESDPVEPKKVEDDLSDLDALTDEEWEAKMRAEIASGATEEDDGDRFKSSVNDKGQLVDGSGRRIASNSIGIAQSWMRDDVRIKRTTRHGVYVTVNGKRSDELKSVRAAFELFGLPDSKHIRFRGILKRERRAIFEWNGVDYHFELA